MTFFEVAMKRFLNAKVMVIASMAIFGTLAPFVRAISVSSGELALYRAILAALIIALFLLLSRQRISFSAVKRSLPLLLVSGAALGFNWILLFEAYKYTTVSVATLSYYFAPIIVTVLCPIIFKEKMHAKQWICFGASTLGIIMLTGIGDLSAGSNHLLGIAFGLGAACLYASVVLLNKFISDVGGIQRTFLQFLAVIVVLLPYVLLTGGFHLDSLSGIGWSSLITVGIVHTGIAYCLYFSSIKELSGQKVAILSYIDPLLAVLVSVTVLREELTLMQALGGLLILGFTLWNEISPQKKRNNKDK